MLTNPKEFDSRQAGVDAEHIRPIAHYADRLAGFDRLSLAESRSRGLRRRVGRLTNWQREAETAIAVSVL